MLILPLLYRPIAYVSLASSGATVFAWLLSLSGLAALFTWGSICLAHIRFRQAWAFHGHTPEELPFKSPFGVWGSWLGLSLNVLVLIATVRESMRHVPFPDHFLTMDRSTSLLNLWMRRTSSSNAWPYSSLRKSFDVLFLSPFSRL